MVGQKILHYKITEKLGEGGMGVVYKAEDTKLGRTVALKFLSHEVLDNREEQERLVNEARAAAGLHHPNICTVYEINEYDGQTFIAMAYVDGETLRDKVLSTTISVDQALDTINQIAQGLKQAHDRGVIHRDIKSANIMINEAGRALIMDFGLAKKYGQVKPEELLSSGGTSAYMSPEQARGEPVDHRTDIWSMGVVLYEMLSGELPFRADYEQAVIYSIINEEPKPLADHRSDLPAEVIAIVERCMAKDPDARYQSMDEMIGALEDAVETRRRGGISQEPGRRWRRRSLLSLGAAAAVVLIGMYLAYDFLVGKRVEGEVRVPIAVIDFNNETDVAALDGLSGMLITALEQSRRLSVMTRTRMFDFLKVMDREDVERIDESIGQEICRKAGVGALVIPTVRRFGDLYTIDLKVLDTKENKYIFTTKEEGRGEESIPSMIDKIARSIRIDLKEGTEVVQANTEKVADVTTVSMEAYKRYFEGEELLNKLDFKGAHKAFQEALDIDSTFALALYRLAYTEWWSRGGHRSSTDHIEKVMDMIDRVPEKERFLVRALQAGLLEGFDAQIPIYRAMSTLYPNDKEMLFGLGDAYFHSNHYDSAQVYFEKLLVLDPTFERALQHLTWTYQRTDQLQKGIAIARQWVKTTNSHEALGNLSWLYVLADSTEKAVQTAEMARDVAPDKGQSTIEVALLKLLAGREEDSAKELQSLIDGDDKTAQVYGYHALGSAFYPYKGKYRQGMKVTGDAAKHFWEEGDTTSYVEALMNEAFIQFWGWESPDGAWEIVRPTLDIPDRYKKNDYWYSLTALYLVSHEFDRAHQAMEKAEKKSLMETKIVTGIFSTLEQTQRGNCDAAQAVYDTVLTGPDGRTVVPEQNLITTRFVVANCLFEHQRFAEATKILESIVKNHAMSWEGVAYLPRCQYLLAKCYEGLGRPQEAVKYYEEMLSLWKNGDKDLPTRIDAESRISALKAASSM